MENLRHPFERGGQGNGVGGLAPGPVLLPDEFYGEVREGLLRLPGGNGLVKSRLLKSLDTAFPFQEE